MSEKRIVVPEGMLKAARKVLRKEGRHVVDEAVSLIVETALEWQSDHPKVPNGLEAASMSHIRPVELLQVAIRDWIHQIYRGPEEIDVSFWTCRLSGCTFTPEEADAICEYVRTAARPRSK